ncbi:MAG TPA: protein translocase subunit SecD [Allosphingosinicella sp.]|nr:protein translocase subunit SecD [Allosphingosinicella sp.]
MLDFPRWKMWAVSLLCLVGIAMAIPSFVPEAQVAKWPAFVPSAQINLGLDLAGGSHLLLQADTSDVAKQRIDQMEEIMRGELRRASPPIEFGDMSTAGGRLSFLVRNPAQVDAAVELARNQTQPVGGLGGQRTFDVDVIDGTRIVITPTQAGLAEALENAMSSAREVVYTRVDPTGAKEVTVIRQGKDRILVQVPGLKDPEGLKALLGKTARLEFKMVAPDQSGVQTGRAQPGTQILPMVGGGRIVVQRRAMVTGEQLIDAKQVFDPNNLPAVSITFDRRGSLAFGKVTQQNVNKPFAIILDNVVLSAPNINEPILGGQALISGSFTVEAATDLAVQLRSGALPVELKVVEERTVGPDLGRDSIRRAVIAGIVGTVGILMFMWLTYGRFGIYANIALVLNVIVILGIMAPFATLTLPGIAGFVLTVGAAVDANVIINERIREEHRRGRRVLDAVEHGYNEARTAIFDANITNVIAGLLLYYFGSGPVKGFAIVMMIGIATSVFTAVTVTRMFVSIWLRKRPTELRI